MRFKYGNLEKAQVRGFTFLRKCHLCGVCWMKLGFFEVPIIMYIITGKYKGTAIFSPGKTISGFRPTTGIVKESIFSVLENILDFAGIRVLDLYAGTGALGFEALSRGAKFVTFVEQNKKLTGCIKETARSLGIYGEACEVFSTRVEVFCKKVKTMTGLANIETGEVGKKFQYDLIFSDAPYGCRGRMPVRLTPMCLPNITEQEKLAKLIFGSGVIGEKAIWVLECGSDDSVAGALEFEGVIARLIKTKQFGGTSFYVYECESLS